MAASKRQERAVELHLQGWSYRRIAAELGYGGPSSVKKAIDGAIRKAPARSVAELRQDIEASTRELLPVFFKQAQSGDVEASREWRELVAVIRKVFGVDAIATQSVQLTASIDGPSPEAAARLVSEMFRGAVGVGAGPIAPAPPSPVDRAGPEASPDETVKANGANGALNHGPGSSGE